VAQIQIAQERSADLASVQARIRETAQASGLEVLAWAGRVVGMFLGVVWTNGKGKREA